MFGSPLNLFRTRRSPSPTEHTPPGRSPGSSPGTSPRTSPTHADLSSRGHHGNEAAQPLLHRPRNPNTLARLTRSPHHLAAEGISNTAGPSPPPEPPPRRWASGCRAGCRRLEATSHGPTSHGRPGKRSQATRRNSCQRGRVGTASEPGPFQLPQVDEPARPFESAQAQDTELVGVHWPARKTSMAEPVAEGLQGHLANASHPPAARPRGGPAPGKIPAAAPRGDRTT